MVFPPVYPAITRTRSQRRGVHACRHSPPGCRRAPLATSLDRRASRYAMRSRRCSSVAALVAIATSLSPKHFLPWIGYYLGNTGAPRVTACSRCRWQWRLAPIDQHGINTSERFPAARRDVTPRRIAVVKEMILRHPRHHSSGSAKPVGPPGFRSRIGRYLRLKSTSRPSAQVHLP
jgi:hypothetical protein